MGYLGRSGLFGFLVVLLVWPGSPSVSADGRIFWLEPFTKNGATIIPGSVQTAHGTLEFQWVVACDGQARLQTLVSFGAGELPPRETDLFLLAQKGGLTLIFAEWRPQLNLKEPARLRPLAEVPTAELFSVLPPGRQPPAVTVAKKKATVFWRGQEQRNGTICLLGVVKGAGRKIEIIWKKKPGHLPELFLTPPVKHGGTASEEKLFLWIQEETERTVICRQAGPDPKKEYVAHLRPLVTLGTKELLAGFYALMEERSS